MFLSLFFGDWTHTRAVLAIDEMVSRDLLLKHLQEVHGVEVSCLRALEHLHDHVNATSRYILPGLPEFLVHATWASAFSSAASHVRTYVLLPSCFLCL